ncbi:peptidylprolyl isomerase [Serinibacter arcticus]|uniref:Peptidyl-prolyl cis-trans isomerase n=1 Tax=Serinibacter arcticus TaxID=1655435 RepID=A0A4Z1E1X8_9MICO|nr:peptidylprolyl isomerase [Serinibacter arcticus]TGO05008.1 putative peptidyl-prolyl cis-trans isomerase B [Serinibacter arcticus]
MRSRRLLTAALATAALTALTGCSNASAPDDTTPTTPAEAGTCEYVPDGNAARDVDAPPAEPEETGTVAATISTDAGDIPVVLDADAAPCTVGSFLSLADQGYFDDTECHRLTTQGIFVLQCGDPTATGTGGPGYSYADELTGSETYPAGTLAMANAGADTNGSQFFLVYEDTQLAPAYTVFGQIDPAGLEVVQTIAAAGAAGGAPDGAPAETVTIDAVTAG